MLGMPLQKRYLRYTYTMTLVPAAVGGEHLPPIMLQDEAHVGSADRVLPHQKGGPAQFPRGALQELPARRQVSEELVHLHARARGAVHGRMLRYVFLRGMDQSARPVRSILGTRADLDRGDGIFIGFSQI